MDGSAHLGIGGGAGQRGAKPGGADGLRRRLWLPGDPADDLMHAAGGLGQRRAAGRALAAIGELLLGGVVVDGDHPTGFADVECRGRGEGNGLSGRDQAGIGFERDSQPGHIDLVRGETRAGGRQVRPRPADESRKRVEARGRGVRDDALTGLGARASQRAGGPVEDLDRVAASGQGSARGRGEERPVSGLQECVAHIELQPRSRAGRTQRRDRHARRDAGRGTRVSLRHRVG